MKCLVLRDVREVKLADLPAPDLVAGEAIVEVVLAGICGSDVHGYLGHSARRSSNLPLVMGHEIVGRIAAIGNEIETGLATGDRVVVQPMMACGTCYACRGGSTNVCVNMQILGIERPGGFAQRVAVPVRQLFPVPSTMTDRQAALVEPLAIQVRAYREFGAALPRHVLVLGAGSQGLLAVLLARLMGIPRIIATDTVGSRLDLALALGATDTLLAGRDELTTAVLALTEGIGVEFAIETAGASASRRDGLASLARGGTFAVVGLGVAETAINFLDLVSQEKRLQGVYCYTDDDFVRALEILAAGRVDIDPLIAIQSLDSGPAAFAAIVDGTAEAVKILLDPAS